MGRTKKLLAGVVAATSLTVGCSLAKQEVDRRILGKRLAGKWRSRLAEVNLNDKRLNMQKRVLLAQDQVVFLYASSEDVNEAKKVGSWLEHINRLEQSIELTAALSKARMREYLVNVEQEIGSLEKQVENELATRKAAAFMSKKVVDVEVVKE